MTLNKLIEEIENAQTIAIIGHTSPDGDCVGSCTSVYQYILDNYKDKTVQIYLQPFKEAFCFLDATKNILHEWDEKEYDLCIAVDCGDDKRFQDFYGCFETAKRTVCIDHHISNKGYADVDIIRPEASSTCELLFDLLDYDKISKKTAESIYLGLVHDTGVFRYSNTTKHSMEVAGYLVEKGVQTQQIIDDTFYAKTYAQNQLLGRALMESILFLNGKCIVTYFKKNVLDFYGATSIDLDGIVDQLRLTKDIEVALFVYEKPNGEYKVSMRSNSYVDVSKIASYFGGGGHVRAAGCTLPASSIHDVINNVSAHIEKQLLDYEQNQEGDKCITD